MKSLVIAEKPSVARDIARVLHCTQKGNGILEGKEYVVTWALGDLVTLADPEEVPTSATTLNINQIRTFNYMVGDIDQQQMKGNLKPVLSGEQNLRAVLSADKHICGLPSSMGKYRPHEIWLPGKQV